LPSAVVSQGVGADRFDRRPGESEAWRNAILEDGQFGNPFAGVDPL
jgi:hypothetical protein